MALTYQAAVEQTITAGEQIHQIVNGTATTEVTVEDGSKVPSIRKALLDNFYFKDPIAWQVGQTENVFNQLRQFTDGSWWYAPSATASSPISMGSTPVGDPLWKIYDFDAIGKLEPRIDEALRRSYAEAGYALVAGSFEQGGTVATGTDVLLYEAEGKTYSWEGALPKVVPAASTPHTTGGVADGAWRPVGDITLREELAADNGASLVGFIQTGVGAVSRTLLDKARESVSVKDFGAVGDGVTDDTPAFNAAMTALPAGGSLHLGTGKTYLLSSTIVLTKPINIIGGSKENTTLLFATAGRYLAAPWKCGIIAVHSTTAIPGFAGEARRSVLSGFTIKPQGSIAAMRGLIAATPIYVQEVDAYNFSLDGMAVMASANASSPVKGNANGATFSNCISQANGGSGFYAIGDDANACVFTGCRAPLNTGYGFYDDSLLGNTYIGCETDGNTGGGYFAPNSKPNRSAYFGCYCEGNQTPTWNIGSRCIRLGGLGTYEHNRAHDGVVLGGMPIGDAYINKGLTFASNEDIANAGGTGAFPGPFSKIDYTGWTYRQGATTAIIKFNGNVSGNYTDWLVDDVPVIRFPNGAVTGNITKNKPYYPHGLSLGSSGRSAIVGAGIAAPTTGTYDAGAIFLNDLPSAGGFIGWVCVTAGTPGVWKTFGAISA